jgi:hypothetical protein
MCERERGIEITLIFEFRFETTENVLCPTNRVVKWDEWIAIKFWEAHKEG